MMKTRESHSGSGAPTARTSSAPTVTTATTGVSFSAAVAGNDSGLSFNNPNYGAQPGNTTAMPDNYGEFDKTDMSPIIPEIRIRHFSFRIREIILAVISVVALVGCLVLVALVVKKSGDTTAGSASAQVASAIRTLCTDPPCLKSAAYAVSNMNTSVKPCDDFHAYACGNFATLHPLDPDVAQRTVFRNLYYENEDKLRTLLESSPRRLASWSAEKKVKDFFMSCVDDYGKMSAGGKPFIEKIVAPLGGWDVLETFDPQSFNLQRNIEKTSIDFWTSALFTFRVATDRYDSSNRVIEIDMSGMGMGWPYYVRPNSQQVRNHYKKFMRTVAGFLARDSGLALNQSELGTKIETFVTDAFDVELQLANITANTVPTGDPHNHEKRITLADLTSQTGNVIDFIGFFRHMFGSSNVNGNTRVILLEDDWLRRVLDMVNEIPEEDKPRKLQNYLTWRLAQSYATEMSWDYIHASRDFFVDQYGVTHFLGTPKHCFSMADKKFTEAIGSLFARENIVDINREKAEEIVRYVKQALLDNIDSNKFMDDATKAKAKAKLVASTDKMGYPDIYMNDASIDNIYQSLTINRSDYFQNLLNLNQFEKVDWTRRLTSGEDRTIWLYNSYDTSMTFYNRWNQLLVPAGILQFPIYDWTLPHYYTYGSIGGLIGHCLVHAIDNWGGFYDEHGNYGPWYSNASLASYHQVERCFAGVYSNKTMGPFLPDGQTTPQTIQVRGRRFAWEGLAETSGIRMAFKAYQKWVADNGREKPTPTPHYTNDQSFFLAYAQTTCFTRTDEYGLNLAQRQRVPENIRTNTALSLLEEFSTAFKCPAGSPMNSVTKCDTF